MIIKNINKYHLTNILKTISSDSSRKFGSSPRDDIKVMSKKKKQFPRMRAVLKLVSKPEGPLIVI